VVAASQCNFPHEWYNDTFAPVTLYPFNTHASLQPSQRNMSHHATGSCASALTFWRLLEYFWGSLPLEVGSGVISTTLKVYIFSISDIISWQLQSLHVIDRQTCSVVCQSSILSVPSQFLVTHLACQKYCRYTVPKLCANSHKFFLWSCRLQLSPFCQ